MRKGAALAACICVAAACSAQASTLKTLYSFCETSCQLGVGPVGALVLDSSGNIFGVASSETGMGGTGPGVVYELQKPRHGVRKYKVLHTFCSLPDCADGEYFQTGLIEDVAGNLYGVTWEGGRKGYGTAFELVRGASGRNWRFRILHAFSRTANDGGAPAGRLTYDGARTGAPYDGVSPLYGTTETGGAFDVGTVYELAPSGGDWQFTLLHSFAFGTDGATPLAGVIADANGNLYGTTLYGGGNGLSPNYAGTIYELAKSDGGWTETVLYRFCGQAGCTDSANPWAALLMDSAGALYGTASTFGPGHSGGASGGAVFRLTPDGGAWDFQVLHGFCARNRRCFDGDTSLSAVTADAAGNLYGVTAKGGRGGNGVLFRIAPDGSYKLKHDFCDETGCPAGATPVGQLSLDGRGRLIGTTVLGGAQNGGTVFSIKP